MDKIKLPNHPTIECPQCGAKTQFVGLKCEYCGFKYNPNSISPDANIKEQIEPTKHFITEDVKMGDIEETINQYFQEGYIPISYIPKKWYKTDYEQTGKYNDYFMTTVTIVFEKKISLE